MYTCRFCHDEQETHTVKRKEVTELICVLCDTRQPVQATCQKCHCRFGKYTCLECNLFDDVDKKQYHCNGCGICRLGGRDRFFHCAKCNMCLPVELQNGHKVSISRIATVLENLENLKMSWNFFFTENLERSKNFMKYGSKKKLIFYTGYLAVREFL